MTDLVDRAQELEERQRAEAIARFRGRLVRMAPRRDDERGSETDQELQASQGEG
jgi:hypothetical protein